MHTETNTASTGTFTNAGTSAQVIESAGEVTTENAATGMGEMAALLIAIADNRGLNVIRQLAEKVKATQPAATGAGEYDRELIARMLADYAFPDPVAGRAYTVDAINIQLVALRAADNRDAAAAAQGAAAAVACGMVIVPYVFTRALEALHGKPSE